jgi:hypothetical protein
LASALAHFDQKWNICWLWRQRTSTKIEYLLACGVSAL